MSLVPPTPSRVPPFVRRRLWVFVAMLFTLIGVLLVVLIAGPRVVGSWGFPRWIVQLAFVPYGVLLTWLILRFLRTPKNISRRLSNGDVPCWECGYSLRALPEAGHCPECGGPYEIESLLGRWQKSGYQSGGGGKTS